jgi:hypothetical protein
MQTGEFTDAGFPITVFRRIHFRDCGTGIQEVLNGPDLWPDDD